MLTEKNPFTPSFGRTPLYMAGRKLELSDFSRAFCSNGNDPYLQAIVQGARGTGKTALLTRISAIAAGNGWVCASTTCGPGMLEDIIQQAYAASSHLIDVDGKARLRAISIGQVLGVEWEPATAAQANWRTRMTQLLEKLNEVDSGLVIIVDEVRANVVEMEHLASVFQHFVREDRRVALIMAGLAHHISALVSSDAVSFLRRATLVSLEQIGDDEIRDAFKKTVLEEGKLIGESALESCVKAIQGFPYMMQLVGFYAWDTSGEQQQITIQDADQGIERARKELRRQVLVPTWAGLSNGDKAFCHSLASGNDTAKAIAADMGKKSNYVSKYKQRLLEQGVIMQDAYAHLSFALPEFEHFVSETF